MTIIWCVPSQNGLIIVDNPTHWKYLDIWCWTDAVTTSVSDSNEKWPFNKKNDKMTTAGHQVVDNHENDGKKSCLYKFWQVISKPACKITYNRETPIKIGLADKKLEIWILLHEYFQKKWHIVPWVNLRSINICIQWSQWLFTSHNIPLIQ